MSRGFLFLSPSLNRVQCISQVEFTHEELCSSPKVHNAIFVSLFKFSCLLLLQSLIIFRSGQVGTHQESHPLLAYSR